MQHSPLLTETWLIIDDDEVFCRILKKSLEKQGNQVLTASNADSALQLAKEQLPKFIILDLNIGDDNGIHLIKPLLAISPTAKILMLYWLCQHCYRCQCGQNGGVSLFT